MAIERAERRAARILAEITRIAAIQRGAETVEDSAAHGVSVVMMYATLPPGGCLRCGGDHADLVCMQDALVLVASSRATITTDTVCVVCGGRLIQPADDVPRSWMIMGPAHAECRRSLAVDAPVDFDGRDVNNLCATFGHKRDRTLRRCIVCWKDDLN